MTTNATIKAAYEASPIWAKFTAGINKIVDEANSRGITLDQNFRDELNKLRILGTMAQDKAVSKAVADDMWNAANG